eukprot:scaffold130844_cov36-Phaeocystis_antarctica.AAC.1
MLAACARHDVRPYTIAWLHLPPMAVPLLGAPSTAAVAYYRLTMALLSLGARLRARPDAYHARPQGGDA